jgi:hypothetical protein
MDEARCSDAIRFYLTTSIFQFFNPMAKRRERVIPGRFIKTTGITR